jgi:hypothetical protein
MAVSGKNILIFETLFIVEKPLLGTGFSATQAVLIVEPRKYVTDFVTKNLRNEPRKRVFAHCSQEPNSV